MSNKKQPKKSLQTSILEKISLSDREVAEAIGKEVFIKMSQYPGMTIKEATGVSDQALEEVYSLAYTFYNQGKYQEAEALFQFLAGTSPKTYKFLLGLGATYHQIKNYEEAAVGFFMALNADPSNPLPAYYVTDCFLKQNLMEEAMEFAQITVEICGNKPEHQILKSRCELIINGLNSKKIII